MATKKELPEKPKAPQASADPAVETSYQMISLDLIDDPQQPMRSDMTEASVEDLVLSIKQVGIIEPIIVKPAKGRYEVIAGHRRTFAARLAKLMIVPCFVTNANEEQTEMLKIHENLYRENVRPADEARHFDYLIQKQKMTPIKIAQLIGKSPAYVGDRLAILEYPDFLKEAMDKGEISFSVAREFSRFDDLGQMRQSVYYAKRSGMTMEMARKWVLDHKRSKENPQTFSSLNSSGNAETAPGEHIMTCVFCRQELRLRDTQVIYVHDHCLDEINNLQITEQDASLKE